MITIVLFAQLALAGGLEVPTTTDNGGVGNTYADTKAIATRAKSQAEQAAKKAGDATKSVHELRQEHSLVLLRLDEIESELEKTAGDTSVPSSELEKRVKSLEEAKADLQRADSALKRRIETIEATLNGIAPYIPLLPELEKFPAIATDVEALKNRFDTGFYVGTDLEGLRREPVAGLGMYAATGGVVFGLDLRKPKWGVRLGLEGHLAASDGAGGKLEVLPYWNVGKVQLGVKAGVIGDAYGLIDKNTSITASEVGMAGGISVGMYDLIKSKNSFACGPSASAGWSTGYVGYHGGQQSFVNQNRGLQFTCNIR